MVVPRRAGGDAGAAQSAAYVQVSGLDKIYASAKGDVAALRGIDLEIGAGEFVSILGPSGCGKSTLLKCVAGLTDITAGSVRIRGQPVVRPPDNMAIVFQRDILLDWRTVIDNVLLPIEFRRLSRKDWIDKARALLKLLGLQGFENRHPWELSGGMRQRVAICRALVQDPDLLLMDEPFGALDAITRDELNLELQRVWLADAKTVMFITHSITEAVFLSDQVMVMSRAPGRLREYIAIDLPRPRSLDMRETEAFGRYTSRIRKLFQGMGLLRGQP
jgi:NitT/TauT family transport system ATP-binding protein